MKINAYLFVMAILFLPPTGWAEPLSVRDYFLESQRLKCIRHIIPDDTQGSPCLGNPAPQCAEEVLRQCDWEKSELEKNIKRGEEFGNYALIYFSNEIYEVAVWPTDMGEQILIVVSSINYGDSSKYHAKGVETQDVRFYLIDKNEHLTEVVTGSIFPRLENLYFNDTKVNLHNDEKSLDISYSDAGVVANIKFYWNGRMFVKDGGHL